MNPAVPAELTSTAAARSRPVTVRRPGARAWSSGGNLRKLAQYGDLFRTLTEHRIRVRYKQSALGLCWAVLQPLALMLIFTVVFSGIAEIPSEGVPYSLFAFTGLLLWSFVSTGLSNATHSLVGHAQLITKVYFPREILPLTYVAAALFDIAVGASVLLGLLAYHGRPLSWHALYAIPIVAIAAMLVTALAFALSALQVRFRDVGIAVPLVLYLWMFATPIAYPLSAVPANYRGWFQFNPMTGLIESFRRAIVHGQAPELSALAFPVGVAALLLPVTYLLFKHAESTMADVI